MKNMCLKANLLVLLLLVAALLGDAASPKRKLAWTGTAYDTPPSNLPSGWNTIVSDNYCRWSDCCEQCEGRCYDDSDCRGLDSPLTCYLREWDGPIPGCSGVATNGWGYCIHPTGGYVVPDPTLDPRHLLIRAQKCTVSNPCTRMCQGVCTSDDQCSGTNACYVLGTETVTDCNELTGTAGVGYCGGSRSVVSPTVSPAPTITESPSWHNREPYGLLILIDECPVEGCPVCSGKSGTKGCAVDGDCATDLECWLRTDRELVSGCSGKGITRANYCYAPNYDYLPPHLVQPPRQPETNVYFYYKPDLPEKCELFAASGGEKINIPFAGESGVGEARRSYGEITYIYLMDYSKSTIQSEDLGACGDTHMEGNRNKVIDCEVTALEAVNTATLASGNVDLVGLIRFDSDAEVLQDLVTPWYQKGNYSRDASIIDEARSSYPSGATNFQAGIEAACLMARSPLNTNNQTVIIMISDGLPNRGTSVEDTIKNNCNGATIMTFAVTAAAMCDQVDIAANMEVGADPNTLEDIATFGGGTCTQVPDVTKLPGILIQLDETTWDGVRILVNGSRASSAIVNYTDAPGFIGPKNTTFTGSVPLGPGEYDLCVEALHSTSGVSKYDLKCTNIVILSSIIQPEKQVKTVADGKTAQFKVTIASLGKKPGCGDLSGQKVAIRDCDGTVIKTIDTDANGEVTYTYTTSGGVARQDCFEACYIDASGNDACTTTTIDWPTIPTDPPDPPSAQPSNSPSTLQTSRPSKGPSEEPTPSPSISSSTSPSGHPVKEESSSPSNFPSRPPTLSPSSKPSNSPSTTPSTAPSKESSGSQTLSSSDSPSQLTSEAPTTLPSTNPSNRPSIPRSGEPSPSPSDRPTLLASVNPSNLPSASSSISLPSDTPSTTPSISKGPTEAPSNSPSNSVVASENPSDAPITSAPVTDAPVDNPSLAPSVSPSVGPSSMPSDTPSTTPSTSKGPTGTPSNSPSKSVVASENPSDAPITAAPVTDEPVVNPSLAPSVSPSVGPSSMPSDTPSTTPSTSKGPTGTPSNLPSNSPSNSVVASENATDAPITSAPVTDAPVTASPNTDAPSIQTAISEYPSKAPSRKPSASLSPSAAPSRHPSPYCNVLEKDTCTLCEAFRSPDYCDPSESFPSLVSARTTKSRNEGQAVSNEGYWFHALEDKIAGYLLTLDSKLMAPQIYCCITNVTDLADCLENSGFKVKGAVGGLTIESGSGIVIKATNFHSNQGVFILVNNTSLGEGQALDLHQNNAMTYTDVITGLSDMQASKIIVEEFIGDDLPVEYKLHVINGKVQAIDVIQDRGKDCGCYAVVDIDFNRLDYYGCFEPGGTGYHDPTKPECTSIDFDTGKMRAGPVKKDMYFCDHVEKPEQCVIDDMIAMAEMLGNRIGVAMRVDMFVAGQTVYVQEYSPNPMNGLRHCAAKMDGNGCVDSCFLGREWKAAGGIYGGQQTAVPDILNGFIDKNDADQCAVINNVSVVNRFPSSCFPRSGR